VNIKKLRSATSQEIKELALRYEVIVSDGEAIGKLVPVDYVPVQRVPLSTKPAKGQATPTQAVPLARPTTFRGYAPIGQGQEFSKEKQANR